MIGIPGTKGERGIQVFNQYSLNKIFIKFDKLKNSLLINLQLFILTKLPILIWMSNSFIFFLKGVPGMTGNYSLSVYFGSSFSSKI